MTGEDAGPSRRRSGKTLCIAVRGSANGHPALPSAGRPLLVRGRPFGWVG